MSKPGVKLQLKVNECHAVFNSKHLQLCGRLHATYTNDILEAYECYLVSPQTLLGCPKRRSKLKPNDEWDQSQEFKFIVGGGSDSDYAKDFQTHQHVSDERVLLN